LVFQEL